MNDRRHTPAILLLAGLALAGCGGKGAAGRSEPLLPAETFTWVGQPVAFSPPPERWYRQGDNGGGQLGVRFILREGGGQVMSVVAYRKLADRQRGDRLARLIQRRDSLEGNQLVREIDLCRPPADAAISERESEAARAVNRALDRAIENHYAGSTDFVAADLDEALRAARSYEATLAELIPVIRHAPETSQHPEWWAVGPAKDTTFAGLPAFTTHDTLLADDQRLLYHEILWVVKGYAFKAVFQGREENLATFHRVVETITFPEPDDAAGP